jgi:hypothetical protein|nr:MAG TPA: Protein of unknown function (DUF2644) [Caudoviricetes sp.]
MGVINMNLLKATGSDSPSLSKFVMFVGLITTTAVVVWQAYKGTLSTEIFSWYVITTFGANSVNKAISVAGKVTELKQLVNAGAVPTAEEETAPEADVQPAEFFYATGVTPSTTEERN